MTLLQRWVQSVARSLPKDQQERYAEQWLADLRDAPSQGISGRQIARGATAFALRSRFLDFPTSALHAFVMTLCVAGALVVAAYALFIGSYPFGNSLPDDATACQVAAQVPNPGVVVDQTTPATAERTWIPLGLICSVDIHKNGHPVVSYHQSWQATITAFVSLLIAAGLSIRFAAAARYRLFPVVLQLRREVIRERAHKP